MSAPGMEQDATRQAQPEAPSRGTAIRHLALGFALLITILFTFALCSLPR